MFLHFEIPLDLHYAKFTLYFLKIQAILWLNFHFWTFAFHFYMLYFDEEGAFKKFLFQSTLIKRRNVMVNKNIGNMEKKEWYSARYDRAFKECMMNEKNQKFLKQLLEHILEVEIENIEYLNNEKIRGDMKSKGMRTDLRLSTNVGRIDLEVNSNPAPYVHPRNFSYLTDEYSHHTLINGMYDEETMFIQINLTYGLLYDSEKKLLKEPKDTEAYHVYELCDNTGKRFVENFKIYEFNMDYYLKMWYDQDEEQIEKEKVLIMLGLDRENLEKLSRKDKVVQDYMEEMDRINEDPKFREYISYEQDKQFIQNTLIAEATAKGIEQGIEQGRASGIEEGITQSVLGFHKNGVSNDIIAKSLNIKEEKVEEIIKNNK